MAIKKIPLPDRSYLLYRLRYDPASGVLYWNKMPRSHFKDPDYKHKQWNARHAGKVAMGGTNNPDRYRRGTLDGVNYQAHRVIWKMMTGDEPNIIDHKDGNRSNNRWSNLRDGSSQDNNRNQKLSPKSKTGFKGVFYLENVDRYKVTISVKNKTKHLGTFDDIEGAIAARKAGEQKYWHC